MWLDTVEALPDQLRGSARDLKRALDAGFLVEAYVLGDRWFVAVYMPGRSSPDGVAVDEEGLGTAMRLALIEATERHGSLA